MDLKVESIRFFMKEGLVISEILRYLIYSEQDSMLIREFLFAVECFFQYDGHRDVL